MLQRVHSISSAPFRKPNVLGKLQESVIFGMMDKPLCVKCVIVSLLECTLNQQISLFRFRSFNSHAKLTLTKGLFHLRLNPTQPYQTSGSWAFYHCNFAEVLFASMRLGKNYLMPFICKWPSPGLNKQTWCRKIFL